MNPSERREMMAQALQGMADRYMKTGEAKIEATMFSVLHSLLQCSTVLPVRGGALSPSLETEWPFVTV